MSKEELSNAKAACFYIELPRIGYQEAWDLQQKIVAAKIENRLASDVILCLEHPPVFTLGRRGGAENLMVSHDFLKQSNIQVIHVERGGDITYHGPGQLVMYPILDIDRLRLGITDLVFMLEDIMIRVSKTQGVPATRNPRNRGVWVGDQKLGSIGLAIRRGVTFHGMALNVNLALTPFDWIHPCGLTNVTMTSLEKEMSHRPSMHMAKKLARQLVETVFGWKLQDITREDLEEALARTS